MAVACVVVLLIAASARGDISINDPRGAGRAARNLRLERECAKQLTEHDEQFQRCWSLYQQPDDTGGHRKPFFDLTVANDGHVTAMVHFMTDTAKARECLRAVAERFTFTPFTDEKSVRLGILEYPSRCSVKDPRRPPDKQAPPPPSP